MNLLKDISQIQCVIIAIRIDLWKYMRSMVWNMSSIIQYIAWYDSKILYFEKVYCLV